MSIRIFTVECPVHGLMEITPKNGEGCPSMCFIPTKKGICSQKLKRIYDAPNIQYKGSGWASKEK